MDRALNYWTQRSFEYANQRSYLDDLYRVYPINQEGLREIDPAIWNQVEGSFEKRDNESLVESILNLELAPIKDSYLSYFKRDKSAIKRNPDTVARLCGVLYDLGIKEIYKRVLQPKEANRQIGPMFGNWLAKGALGITPVSLEEFVSSNDNAILNASDAESKRFAQEQLHYTRDKGLDFVARFNGRYVIGEAKFLTDFGGHQNAQLNDAIVTLSVSCNAVNIAILDGVIYIPGKHKMNRVLYENTDKPIMSALVLRDFLYQL